MVDTETILIAGLAAVAAFAGGELLDDEGKAPATKQTKQSKAAGRTDKQRSGSAQTGTSDRKVQVEVTKEFEERGIKRSEGRKNVNPETGGVTTGTENPTVTAPQTGDTSEDGTIEVGELSDKAKNSNLSEEDKEAFRTLSISGE